jgi:sulfur-oxidizing protein SoxA
MLLKIAKTSVLVAVTAVALNAANFNAQAEKDRIALEKYTVAKFKDPMGNKYTFFPYSTDDELKKMRKDIPAEDFKDGTYAFDLIGKVSRDDMMEMPPFDENIEKGEAAYEAHFKKCFPKADILGDYPKFDEKSGKVVTISEAIVDCAKKEGLPTGKKGYNYKGGKTADLQAYFGSVSAENEKKFDIKIDSAAAAAAYEKGKKEFYTQRGYLELSCAECHVQGAGQRVRLQYLSTTFGHVTHFPVYRTGKGKLYTLEGRLGGCVKNMGQKPAKPNSDWSSDVLYFMSYMSNGMPVTGSDVRR